MHAGTKRPPSPALRRLSFDPPRIMPRFLWSLVGASLSILSTLYGMRLYLGKDGSINYLRQKKHCHETPHEPHTFVLSCRAKARGQRAIGDILSGHPDPTERVPRNLRPSGRRPPTNPSSCSSQRPSANPNEPGPDLCPVQREPSSV